jgi:GTPase SAR1 family protein
LFTRLQCRALDVLHVRFIIFGHCISGKETGREKAKELNAVFYEVSAKTGDRVEDLFLDLAKTFVEKSKPAQADAQPQSIQLTKAPKAKKKKSALC